MAFSKRKSTVLSLYIAVISALAATASPIINNDIGKGAAVLEPADSSFHGSLSELPAPERLHMAKFDSDSHDIFLESIPDSSKDLESFTNKQVYSSGGVEKSSSDQSSVMPIEDSKSVWQSFGLALVMILVSEVGDKTFFIAAVMAMKSPRMTVFSASFLALVLMTIVSAYIGQVLPSFISKKYTNYLASFLFLGFGLRMLSQAYRMPKNETSQDEIQQVEAELDSRDSKCIARITEEGKVCAPALYHYEDRVKVHGNGDPLDGLCNLCALAFSPIWIQTFGMTFLGEWGDRSQVSTMLMAAGRKYTFVIIGAIAGHGVCTAVAVIGGKLVASRISIRTVTYFGSLAFLCFCVIYFYQATLT